MNQSFIAVSTPAKRGKLKRRKFSQKVPDFQKRSSTFYDVTPNGTNQLKGKLDHFYQAYNKAIFFEDGMNFSEDEESRSELKTLKVAANQTKRFSNKWGLLQSKRNLHKSHRVHMSK